MTTTTDPADPSSVTPASAVVLSTDALPLARDDIQIDIGSWFNQLWGVMAPITEQYAPGTAQALVDAFAGPAAGLIDMFLPGAVNDAIHAIGPGLAVLDKDWKINLPHNVITDAIIGWMNANASGVIALAGAKVAPIVANMVAALKLPPPAPTVAGTSGKIGSR